MTLHNRCIVLVLAHQSSLRCVNYTLDIFFVTAIITRSHSSHLTVLSPSLTFTPTCTLYNIHAHTHMHTHTHARMHARTHARTHTCMHSHTHTNTNTNTHTHAYTPTHTVCSSALTLQSTTHKTSSTPISPNKTSHSLFCGAQTEFSFDRPALITSVELTGLSSKQQWNDTVQLLVNLKISQRIVQKVSFNWSVDGEETFNLS